MSVDLDVVTVGEAMVMLVADEPGALEAVRGFHKRTAGAETNVAIGLARLGLRVGWGSRLGADSMGRYLLAEMQREGIDCSRVAMTGEAPTGFQFKGRVSDGTDPPVEYHRRGSAASRMTPADLDEAWLLRARHLHVTGVFAALSPGCLALVERAIDVMRHAGRSVSFDPNLRPTLWPSQAVMRQTLDALAAQCHWVLPGVEEGFVLTGSRDPALIARAYRERGVQRVVVKLGAQGAYYDDCDRGCGFVPAFAVAEVVDTVGAGDGFAVGVISALLAGRDIAAAARRGAWIGARAVQVVGDTEGLPTRAQLDAAGL
ncbi:MAG: sugar kinase [Proteobacteria bacterium]|nr:sugar kinase [Pseudomonadota bacterium]